MILVSEAFGIHIRIYYVIRSFVVNKNQKKKYPNKLGRIAPLIFWFADWSEKELIFKTTDFQNHLSYLFQ